MMLIPSYINISRHFKKSAWLFLLAFYCSSIMAAYSFSISYAQVSKQGDDYVLNARISYPLTPRVTEALDNGVPIVFFQAFKLLQTNHIFGDYWPWTTTLWQTEMRYELRYHALTQQYIVQSLDTGKRRSFPTLYSALDVMGNITDLSLPPEHLATIDDLQLQIRSGLDLYALPTPMRPGALISDKWDLSSPWVMAQWQ